MTVSVEANKQIVRRWVKEVFNEHRLDSVEKLKVPDYVDWNPYPGQDGALQGFKNVLADFFTAFPDFRYDVDEELGEGDIIVCLGTWSGTHTRELNGMKPTGKRISAKRIDIVRFSGDKMAERWGTGNELKMLQLMGVLKPGQNAGRADGPRTIVSRFAAEALGAKNLATVDELVDREARQNAAGTAAVALLAAALTELRVELGELAVDGDRAKGTLTISGVHSGELMGVAPTGAPLSLEAPVSVRLDAGTIVESRIDLDLDALAAALGGAGRPAPPPQPAPADSKVLVRRFMDQVFNQRRLDVIPQLVAADATDHLQESLSVLAVLNAFPDFQLGFDRMVVEGNRVTVLANFAGTHTGEFMGIAPTGKGVITRTISMFTVEDGKITDSMYNFDFFPIITQLRGFPSDAVHQPAQPSAS